jgi:hypothetical protein
MLFTLPDESHPDPYAGLDDLTPPDLDWDDETQPEVTVTQAVDAQGEKFIILDAAKEPIDSTREPRKVQGLLAHWQSTLYGRQR